MELGNTRFISRVEQDISTRNKSGTSAHPSHENLADREVEMLCGLTHLSMQMFPPT